MLFITLVGGTRLRFPGRLKLMEESLMSDATLAESDSRSSLDSALLDGLHFRPTVGCFRKIHHH